MSRDEIAVQVRKAIADHFAQTGHRPQPKDIEDATTLTDMGADSLDSIEIIVALEDAFDVEISDAEAENLKTFGQAVDYLVKRLGAPVPA